MRSRSPTPPDCRQAKQSAGTPRWVPAFSSTLNDRHVLCPRAGWLFGNRRFKSLPNLYFSFTETFRTSV